MYWNSVVNKLTILFTIAISALLIVTGLFAYFVLSEMIDSGERQYLVDEIYIMRAILEKNANNLNSIRQEVAGVPEALEKANYHYYVEILDTNGKTLMQTPKMNQVLKQPQYPELNPTDWEKRILKWRDVNGKTHFSLVAPLQLSKDGKVTTIAKISIDSIYPQQILAEYQNKIIIFMLIAFIYVIVLSRLISRKGLAPLTDMISLTEKITVSELSERIDLKNYPIELVALGLSLNTMLDRLEQAYHRMSECAAELAHELRTPINNLMLSTDITLSKRRKLSEYREVLENNITEYHQLANIIENIMFIARSDNNQIILNYAHINLRNMIEKMCQFYSISATEKQISLNCSVEGEIHADPILLQRAIANLLDNAIKFTPARGEIKIIAKSSDDHTHIAVHDSGQGIAPEVISNLGCRGYRNLNTIQSKNTGLGLGLALVKSIMNMHNGELKLSKSDLGGAQVVLKFQSCLSS